MIEIREMAIGEFSRIIEIDRSEDVQSEYFVKEGVLVKKSINVNIPTWKVNTEHEFQLSCQFVMWRSWAEGTGVLIGAFSDEKLIGLIIYRPDLTRDMGWLALLHISREYRGCGIGQVLCREVFHRARKQGNKSIYVSSISTCRTVDFYQSQGFTLTLEPHPDLFELEPDDIHMIKIL